MKFFTTYYRVLSARGFLLLEVVFAVVILSFTFLGIAMLLAKASREERSAVFLSRSAILASDIAERMRVDSAALAAGGFITPQGSYATLTGTVVMPVCGGPYITPPRTSVMLPVCSTAAASAAYDFAVWQVQAQTSFTGGLGIVSAGAAGSNSRQIIVAWSEPVTDKNGTGITAAVNASCPATLAAPPNVRCYTMDFRL